MTGEDTLPSEEQTLLPDDYNSDGEDGEGGQEQEEEQDQGCLKVTHPIHKFFLNCTIIFGFQ